MGFRSAIDTSPSVPDLTSTDPTWVKQHSPAEALRYSRGRQAVRVNAEQSGMRAGSKPVSKVRRVTPNFNKKGQ